MSPRLVVPAALALLVVPWLIDNQFVLLMLSLTGITYLVALGLNLVMGFAGQVSLGHAALFGVGAYTSAILTLRHEQPFPIGLLAAGLVAGLVGLLLGVPSLRLSGAYLAMATMAFNLIVQRLMVNWSGLTGGPDGLPGLPGAQIGPIIFDRRSSVYLVAGVALACLLVARNLVRSRYGRDLLAIREDELAASCLGVNLYRAKLLVFCLSAVYAGLAGSLFAHLYRHISPISFGLEASLEFLLAVIIGGPGSLAWPLGGALLVTVLPQLPALQDLQEYRLLVYGGLLLASVLVLRRGLAGAYPWPCPGTSEPVEAPSAGTALTVRVPRTGGPESSPGRAAAHADRQPGPPAPLLTIEHLALRFGGVIALDGVSLAVEAGAIHGLIGPNGSGKTTLLNVVSGVYRPDSGLARLSGQSINGLAPHRLANLGLARTFQNLRLFRELSVLQNIQAGQHTWLRPPLATTLLGLPRARELERHSERQARQLGARLGLADVLDSLAQDLPQGRQRRLELTRALAARPRLLLLDEPAAGLSGPEITALAAILGEARAAGMTILLVEHHLELVLELCDRVTVLHRGKVIADGPPKEVRDDPAVAAAYLGARRPAAAPAAPALGARPAGAPLLEAEN